MCRNIKKIGNKIYLNKVFISATDPEPDQLADPLDPQDFGFLDPDPEKYADPRIQGVKYQPKTAKKLFYS